MKPPSCVCVCAYLRLSTLEMKDGARGLAMGLQGRDVQTVGVVHKPVVLDNGRHLSTSLGEVQRRVQTNYRKKRARGREKKKRETQPKAKKKQKKKTHR